jgi:alpha-galactosidase
VRFEAQDGDFFFTSAVVSLYGLRPVINGIVYDVVGEKQDDGTITFRLPESPIILWIEVTTQPDTSLALRYGLNSVPDEFALLSFGIRFQQISNLRAFLRSGYHSWDGSYFVQPEQYPVGTTQRGYAMAQLLPLYGDSKSSVVFGFDRHDRYQQTFTLERTTAGCALTIETLWDEKDRSSIDYCESERLVIFEHHDGVEEALRDWARRVAEVMSARVSAPPILGWCSWYNLYAYINEENILEHLEGVKEAVEQDGLLMNIFQIDDGFTPEMGDWLDVKPQFPRGVKALMDDIRAAGFIPGLWIGPFMVGNRSRLYREHPDWVVIDRQTNKPLVHMQLLGEFRWHKRSEEYYVLDATHPEAFEYLRKVFRTWRHEWGAEYFKTDFMEFGSAHGPDRAIYHQPGMTRIEIWRKVAEMIREEIDDALWLGCGCPLWASVGLVDAVRIGRDVGVQWEGESLAAQSLLRDQATRNFANNILWQADPDCILIREQHHKLTEAEVRSLALYAGMSSGLVTTSDDLAVLSPERLRLWKLLLNPEKSICRFPLLGQSPLTREAGGSSRDEWRALDPLLVQVRTAEDAQASDPAAIFLLNPSEQPIQRELPLSLLGVNGERYVHNWMTGQTSDAPLDRLWVTIPPHDGVLYFATTAKEETSFERLP